MPEEIHIASLVVQALPENLVSVATAITEMDGVEIHAKGDNGKIVVVLEAPGTRGLTDKVSEIERIPSVVSAQLIYHQIDDDDLDDNEISVSANKEKILSC